MRASGPSEPDGSFSGLSRHFARLTFNEPDNNKRLNMSQLPQVDRFCDETTDHPHWNESVWFSYSIPEQRKHGFIQYYFRPNMGLLNGGPVMWDPSGNQVWNCLYYNWSHLQACPQDAEKFNFTAPNSLSVEVLEPATRYAIGYDNDDFYMDLEWRAMGPIHRLKSKSPGQQSAQKYHMEQPGRMTGIVRLDGKEFPIDCYSMRDTSYGPRVYDKSSVGGYFWGIAEDRAFHAIAKGTGSTQEVIGGFIWKDDKLGSLVSGTRRVEEFGPYGPRRVLFEAADEHGRTISATGKLDDGLIFTGYTDRTVVWSLLEWDWDGITHWGDNQEFCNSLRFRRIARGDIRPGD